jgi:alkylated DNA repair dioxygenase AlkB
MIEIIENFVDEDFEKAIISMAKKAPKNTVKGRSKIMRWGSDIYRDKDNLSLQIPEIFLPLKDKILFNNAQINQYNVGDYAQWHIDDPKMGETIHIISLLSDCKIRFRKDDTDLLIEEHTLPRFSYMKFYGEKRWKWKHSVFADKPRYSVVLRNMTL